MTSIAFRTLDQQVIDGLGDVVAIDDGSRSFTYAQLLAQTAALAGGLAHLGVRSGTRVLIDVGDKATEVLAVLACARLGAVPVAEAQIRIEGDPPVVTADGLQYAWADILRAGSNDPAPALGDDEPGYDHIMRDAYEEIFATLSVGGTIS